MGTRIATPQTQRSVPDVLNDIAANLQEIVRSEIRLAKAEAREKLTRSARPAVVLCSGMAIAFYAGGFLLLAAVYGLSIFIAAWLAALVVGAVLAVVAFGLINSAANKFKGIDFVPTKTVASLEEDIQWTKRPIK